MYLKMGNINNTSINQTGNNGSKNVASTSKKMWPTHTRTFTFNRKHDKERSLNGVRPRKRKKEEILRVKVLRKNFRNDKGKYRIKEQKKVLPSSQYQQPMEIQSTTSHSTDRFATIDVDDVYPSQINAVDHNTTSPQQHTQGENYHCLKELSKAHENPGVAMTSTSTGMNSHNVPPNPSMHEVVPPMLDFCPKTKISETLFSMPQKPVKVLTSCTLYSPPSSAPSASRRERPNGCTTVYVSGLPEKITEDIVKEVFLGCGEIASVRMDNKNFCHVTFTNEHHVNEALFFSGYHIKIENKDEPSYCGCLNVDYAAARNDKYEHVTQTFCKEASHGTLPIAKYSEWEADKIRKKLRNNDTLDLGRQVLIKWLEQGECNKRNAGTFYSMIQRVHGHVRRLVVEKTKIEYEFQEVGNKLTQKCISNRMQFRDIDDVFKYAFQDKVWEHFTKAQRKFIKTWKNNTAEIKKANSKDLIEDQVKNQDSEKSEMQEELNRLVEDNVKLQEENQLLRNQLKASIDEAAFVKTEADKKITEQLNTNQLLLQNYLVVKKKLENTLNEKLAGVNIKKDS